MTAPLIQTVRVEDYLNQRFNPIAGLTPQRLSMALDQFRRGHLRELAWIMEAIEERDDTVAAVAPKRKKAPTRYGWEILTLDDSAEAARHQEALLYFYNQLSATNAIEQDETGDMSLFLQQMMDAVGMRYAVHEIVFEPAGSDLTATMWKVPLAFFEGTTGRLRFLRNINEVAGSDMDPRQWLVSVGQGIGVASSVAYMYKQLPLKDWIVYSRRHGMPGIEGVTDQAPGTAEWEAMRRVVQMAGSEMAWVRSSSQAVNKVDFGATGELPYPALVDRMDRALSRLWRGVDLSTMSSAGGEGRGASLQGDESDILEQDDAAWLSRSLVRLSRLVIEWHFGTGTRPLAYLQVKGKPKPQDVQADIEVDSALLRWGVPLSVQYAREKYGRPEPAAGDDLLEVASAPEPGAAGAPPASPGAAANEILARNAVRQLAPAQAAALAPFAAELRRAATIADEQARLAALRELRGRIPQFLIAANASPEFAAGLEEACQTAFLNGAAATAFLTR